MATLRRADVFDLFATQEANLINLPENYVLKYYFFHALSWPQLLSVAHSTTGKLVGYVLAKMEEEDPADRHGHVTSVAVLRQSRKLGLASKLMKLTQAAMQEVFDAQYASLHVRVTNRAAYSLYKHTLSYRIHEIDPEYYADKEDAFNMRTYFESSKRRLKQGREEAEAVEANDPAAAAAAGKGDGAAAEGDGAATTTVATAATPSRKHKNSSTVKKKTEEVRGGTSSEQQQQQPKPKHQHKQQQKKKSHADVQQQQQ